MQTNAPRIVVGIEGTPRSDPALEAALEFSQRLGGSLDVVHALEVVRPLWPWIRRDELEGLHAAHLAEARSELERHLRECELRLGCEYGSLWRQLEVTPGDPPKVLAQRAKETQALALFLGPLQPKGRVGRGRTLRSTLHLAPCDVWTQPGPWRSVRRILAPVDFSDCSLGALARAREVAALVGGEVTVLHCFRSPVHAFLEGEPEWPGVDVLRHSAQAQLEELDETFEWGGIEHRTLLDEGSAAETIVERAKDVDLVVMGTHGRVAVTAFALGNVAAAVIARSSVPVLAVRHPERAWPVDALKAR